MTSIVGIYCKDGVVIGTDSSATFAHGQFNTIEQQTEKLEVIDNRVVVAGTGSVGLGQRFCEAVKTNWLKKNFPSTAVEVGKYLSRLGIDDFRQTYTKEGQYGALVAFPIGQKHHLCELDIPSFQPELKIERLWYCSMGITQPITDPFLAFMREVFWTDGLPTVQDAVFAVTWTLDHAIQVNPGGVNGPVRVAILNKRRKDYEAYMLTDSELGEHRQNIEEAKASLRQIRQRHHPDSNEQTLQIPKP